MLNILITQERNAIILSNSSQFFPQALLSISLFPRCHVIIPFYLFMLAHTGLLYWSYITIILYLLTNNSLSLATGTIHTFDDYPSTLSYCEISLYKPHKPLVLCGICLFLTGSFHLVS